MLQNTSKIWQKLPIEAKKRWQKLIFPEGIVLDTKNREFLTKNYNTFFSLTRSISFDFENKKNELSYQKIKKSVVVAGKYSLSNQIVNDFVKAYEFSQTIKCYMKTI